MSVPLRECVAVVTGASSGIGRATARELAARGARTILGGRDTARLDALVAELRAAGHDARAVAGDLRDERAIPALVDAALHAHGRLDVWVNNAGVGHPGPLRDGRTEAWREMLETNVLALCVACREAARAMGERGGTILNVSSEAATRAAPNDAVYAATKAAVSSLTASLRAELADTNTRVLLLEPGQVITSFARHVPHAALREHAARLGLDPDAVPDFEGGHLPEAFERLVLERLPEHFAAPEAVARRIAELLEADDEAPPRG